MSEIKTRLFDQIFGRVAWFEEKDKRILHIERSTGGKSGHWIAHPFCNRRLKNWIGFEEIHYAKTDFVCKECVTRFLKTFVDDHTPRDKP